MWSNVPRDINKMMDEPPKPRHSEEFTQVMRRSGVDLTKERLEQLYDDNKNIVVAKPLQNPECVILWGFLDPHFYAYRILVCL